MTEQERKVMRDMLAVQYERMAKALPRHCAGKDAAMIARWLNGSDIPSTQRA